MFSFLHIQFPNMALNELFVILTFCTLGKAWTLRTNQRIRCIITLKILFSTPYVDGVLYVEVDGNEGR